MFSIDYSSARMFQTNHKGIETLFHAHIVAFLKVAEVDLIVFFLKVVIRQLIETGRHDCENDRRKSVREPHAFIRNESRAAGESEKFAIESAWSSLSPARPWCVVLIFRQARDLAAKLDQTSNLVEGRSKRRRRDVEKAVHPGGWSALCASIHFLHAICLDAQTHLTCTLLWTIL
jgi:hypothetical protein